MSEKPNEPNPTQTEPGTGQPPQTTPQTPPKTEQPGTNPLPAGGDQPPGTKEEGKKEAPATQAGTLTTGQYDLKLPENSLLDRSAIEKIASFAKERGFSNQQAQAVLELQNEAVTSFLQTQNTQIDTQAAEWAKLSESDKEYGGENFPKNINLAKLVVNKYGSEALRKSLAETGLGNHPELVRFCVRIGKEMSEDELVVSGAQSSGRRALEDVFYPNNTTH